MLAIYFTIHPSDLRQNRRFYRGAIAAGQQAGLYFRQHCRRAALVPHYCLPLSAGVKGAGFDTRRNRGPHGMLLPQYGAAATDSAAVYCLFQQGYEWRWLRLLILTHLSFEQHEHLRNEAGPSGAERRDFPPVYG